MAVNPREPTSGPSVAPPRMRARSPSAAASTPARSQTAAMGSAGTSEQGGTPVSTASLPSTVSSISAVVQLNSGSRSAPGASAGAVRGRYRRRWSQGGWPRLARSSDPVTPGLPTISSSSTGDPAQAPEGVRRKRPGQAVALDQLPALAPHAEHELRDVALIVRLDPMPVIERRLGQPVRVVDPVRTVRRVVEAPPASPDPSLAPGRHLRAGTGRRRSAHRGNHENGGQQSARGSVRPWGGAAKAGGSGGDSLLTSTCDSLRTGPKSRRLPQAPLTTGPTATIAVGGDYGKRVARVSTKPWWDSLQMRNRAQVPALAPRTTVRLPQIG